MVEKCATELTLHGEVGLDIYFAPVCRSRVVSVTACADKSQPSLTAYFQSDIPPTNWAVSTAGELELILP